MTPGYIRSDVFTNVTGLQLLVAFVSDSCRASSLVYPNQRVECY